jgi:lipopolysaccharide/colanic/teichoic acid biosynthesis glycosyltransferase/glycosyltransferase involved in cell wall biosynthesis
MHVLYFHQYFSTPDGSGGTRSYEISKRLLASGHRVTMVCGATARAESGLSGPYLKGRREGSVDGIWVIEMELQYSNYDSFLRRSWTFLRFAGRSVILALKLDYDLVFATSTPLTAALPGIAARWLRRKPFVFEVRDLWPELPRAMGVLRNPLVLSIMGWLEFVAYRSANACIALSPGIAQGIIRRGVTENRVVTAPNGCNLDLFAADMSQPLHEIAGLPPDAFVATFTGAHGLANGLDAVLDAAAELQERGRCDIYFVFIGEGKEKPGLVQRAHCEKLDNCLFVAPIPKKALAQFLCRRANVGLMILANVSAFYYGTSPNKFFDYLASSLPVLVNYPGWMAEMVTAQGAGMAINPEDPRAFADALMKMADARIATAEMGLHGRILGEREFLQATLAQRCVSVMEGAVAMGPGERMNAYRRWGKRGLDLSVLLVASPIALLVAIIVALIVRLQMGSPVFFRQARPGFKAEPFTLLKFRTMNSVGNQEGNLLPDRERLTELGKALRRYSVDELPQLWNVLKGEMSVVGPRPLLMRYVDRYTPEQARRHDVKPGITGWAQVNGRNALSWEQKFDRDVWYVDHVSVWLDLKIIVLTIWSVLRRRGISQPGMDTAEEFVGLRRESTERWIGRAEEVSSKNFRTKATNKTQEQLESR